MARAQVLRDLYAVLEGYAPLAQALGHVVGATTLEQGARIIGDSVRLRPHPIPGLVMGLGGSQEGRGGPSMPEGVWEMPLAVYALDVFQAAALLDHLEDCIVAARWPNSPVRRVQWLGHQQLSLEEAQEFIVCQAVLRLSLVTGR